MNGFSTIRINYLGGIVSPGELRDLLIALKICEVRHIRFGLRQQLIFHLSYLHELTFKQRMEVLGIDYYIDTNPHPNVVSSYVSEEVFQQGNWLSEGIYKDIFDTIDFNPRLKINISDSGQSFTPFFSGHINFISSDVPNFWYLYVRKPKSNDLQVYEKLVFSNEIGAISKHLQEALLNEEEVIFDQLPTIISAEKKNELKLPKFTLPYYEGFNRYGSKTWLGIYKRSELFDINFLIDLCSLCLETKVGEICLTPWKSIIVKNIKEDDRKKWSALLAKFDINVRHAANELNWQIEDASEEGLKLKQKLIKYFNERDLRTFGICLGVKTLEKTEVFASIMVKKHRKFLVNLYDITYTTDYDPNGRNVAHYAKNLPGFMLAEKLRQSILLFNEHIAEMSLLEDVLNEPMGSEDVKQNSHEVFQCQSCLTIYDETYGDEQQGIAPGVSFDYLPISYGCSICGSKRDNFKAVDSHEMVLQFNA